MRSSILTALVFVACASARAESSLQLLVEPVVKQRWVWSSFKVAVRIRNSSNKPVTFKPPFVGERVGDPWTTVDFLVEKNGMQYRKRYTGAYEANWGQPRLTLKPGEISAPFVFDIQGYEPVRGEYWYQADANGKVEYPYHEVGKQLHWGRYNLKVRFFNPVDSKYIEATTWKGEVISESIEFTVI